MKHNNDFTGCHTDGQRTKDRGIKNVLFFTSSLKGFCWLYVITAFTKISDIIHRIGLKEKDLVRWKRHKQPISIRFKDSE